jgi:hypothetical protein
MDCWHDEIENATSEAEVVKSAADYLALWAPREIPPIILGLKSLRIESSEDIVRVKENLADSPAKSRSLPPEMSHLRELADYFGHAASRIGEIRRRQARGISPISYLR